MRQPKIWTSAISGVYVAHTWTDAIGGERHIRTAEVLVVATLKAEAEALLEDRGVHRPDLRRASLAWSPLLPLRVARLLLDPPQQGLVLTWLGQVDSKPIGCVAPDGTIEIVGHWVYVNHAMRVVRR